MGKIVGEKSVIEKAKSLKSGNGSCYINFEAIESLPEEYEACVSEVTYDPSNLGLSFSDVGGGSWMPQPSMLYDIAEKCGIGGISSHCEAIIQQVDINPLLRKNLEDPPVIQNRIVGYKSKKQSSRLQEDGTFLPSSVCEVDFNAWERCLTLWADEENELDGYLKLINGEYTVKEYGKYVKKIGLHYKKAYTKEGVTTYYDAEPKYDTKFKRDAHFKKLLKFAQRITQTQAHEKTIRELAHLFTGYKTEQLKSGSMFFAKVRRSSSILKAESAARLSALSQGITPPALIEASQELFGVMPDIVNITPEPEPTPVETPVEKTKREIAFDVLKKYVTDSIIPEKHTVLTGKLLDWLSNPANTDGTDLWDTLMTRIKTIEADIPETLRIKHGL